MVTEEIPFPYEPYEQQRQLMHALYDAMKSAKCGCFESPTGTGKSLSAICAALYWQEQEETRIISEYERQVEESAAAKSKNDDWLADILQGDTKASTDKEAKRKKGELDRLNAMKERVAKSNNKNEVHVASTAVFGSAFAKGGKDADKASTTAESGAEEDEFMLPAYDSDDASSSKAKGGKGKGAAAAGKAGLGSDDDDDDEEREEETDLPLPKIFYCSRTHTQIAQFVTEIRRTRYAGARVVTLGSRRNMCIHPTVSRLASDVRMSDRCLEMQKSGGKATTDQPPPQAAAAADGKKQKVTRLKACEFRNRRLEERFADQALGRLRDIEELVVLGKELKACPYYSTRRAVRYAQVVCMPYNVLLHADLRASMGVELKGGVVIFDEAHNLVEAVNHTHSSETTLSQLNTAAAALSVYLARFQYQLAGRNVYYINLLVSVVRKLRQCLQGMDKLPAAADAAHRPGSGSAAASSNANSSNSGSRSGSSGSGGGGADKTILLSCNEFTFQSGLDNVNLFKLRRHMLETNLIARIGGFAESHARKAAAAAAGAAAGAGAGAASSSGSVAGTKCGSCAAAATEEASALLLSAGGGGDDFSATTHALRSLLSLLTCLTNNDADGRVALLATPSAGAAGGGGVFLPEPPTLSIRFILLNPSVHFRRIVHEARCVLLLGGTLRPFSFVASSLFQGVPKADLRLFSCDHVVDKSSVVAVTVQVGPSGKALEFTHGTRQNKATTDELLAVLVQACSSSPHGVVCFFTSYAYLDSLLSTWRQSGGAQMAQITRRKPVFVESRVPSESEAVWQAYCTAAATPRGALLLCVMGGKLSEGINFSDHLARCVVVVGMPYPDLRDPILQEKLKHSDTLEPNTQASKRVYEAMCMKSVNQSIGRSIRHVKDYAAILLVDRRYSQPRVIAQLPRWIERSVVVAETFATVKERLEGFFSSRVG